MVIQGKSLYSNFYRFHYNFFEKEFKVNSSFEKIHMHSIKLQLIHKNSHEMECRGIQENSSNFKGI